MRHSITFTELVRKIHPDMNPGVEDAGHKMTQAVRFRDNPEHLFRLGVRWGVVTAPDGFQTSEDASSSVSTRFRASEDGEVYPFTCGDIVSFTNRVGSYVIVHVSTVRNGPRRGWNKYDLAFIGTNKLYSVKTAYSSPRTGHNFVRIAHANDSLWDEARTSAFSAWDRFQSQKQAASQARKEFRDLMNERREEEAREMGIHPNRNYEGTDTFIYVKTLGRYCLLIRTSAKMAFYKHPDTGETKRCKLSSILYVRNQD